jgi:hypothetical protein
LEQQVLKQTKLSGATIGIVLAGSAGYALGLVDAETKGFRGDEAHQHALKVAAAMALVGGGIGWELGGREGEKIVDAAMERDSLKQLNQGAVAYNQNAANFNTRLRNRMNEVKFIPDPNQKRKHYGAMLGESTKKARDLDQRISMRQAAVGNLGWRSSQKVTLDSELEDLVRYRDSLERTNQELKEAYNSTVPL